MSLWLFLTFNVFLYLLIFYPEFASLFGTDFKGLLSFRTTGIVIAPIVLFMVNGFLTSDQKAFLVYWRRRDTLPGHRAFTKYAIKDPRVDLERLEQLHGALPTGPKTQNKLWYKIYRSNKEEIIVRNSHKAFLLARDLCAQAFLFLVFSIVILFFSTVTHRWIYCLLAFAEFLLMLRLAQNNGRRFVRNVLAIESTK